MTNTCNTTCTMYIYLFDKISILWQNINSLTKDQFLITRNQLQSPIWGCLLFNYMNLSSIYFLLFVAKTTVKASVCVKSTRFIKLFLIQPASIVFVWKLFAWWTHHPLTENKIEFEVHWHCVSHFTVSLC